MRLTTQQLKRIIKEELANVINEDLGQMAADMGYDAEGTAAQRMQARKQASKDEIKKKDAERLSYLPKPIVDAILMARKAGKEMLFFNWGTGPGIHGGEKTDFLKYWVDKAVTYTDTGISGEEETRHSKTSDEIDEMISDFEGSRAFRINDENGYFHIGPEEPTDYRS